MEKIIRTVCFTGHRDIAPADAVRLPGQLERVIRELYARGAREFRAGGALGFDMVAALKVLTMRDELTDLRLVLVLPCRDQTAKWNEPSVRTYRYIEQRADEVKYLFDRYIDGCMLERDRCLVTGSDVCVAYCAKSTGGTAYTFTYALKNGLEVINLYDRLRAEDRAGRSDTI